jgi:hypothetical protein
MQLVFSVIKYSYLLIVLMLLSGFYFTSTAQNHISEIKSLAEGSDIIVIGKVTNQNSAWNEDKSRIFTHVTIKVDEYLKGNTGNSQITVSHLGGEIGEVGELYSHTPGFVNNEEVLLFVKKDTRDNTFKIFQGENGKMTILHDKDTGERMTTWHRDINSLKQEIRSYTEK